ncbi:fibroblast growth factor branchless [Haematobia irritans]|uniref:fibroblast growth factor branchless n=1 Tax=Haematobia irritans TaxID=7368 RepID=UPI003F50B574
MRRNLRLDWRALALLGALLAIIIDWPCVMYAMPVAAPAGTLYVIKNDKLLNMNRYEYDPDDHVRHIAKMDEFKPEAALKENSSNFPSNPTTSDLQIEQRRTTTNLTEQLMGTSVSPNETNVMPQKRQSMTKFDKQEVNENLNSISRQIENDKISKTVAVEDEAGGLLKEPEINSPEVEEDLQDDDNDEEEEELSSKNTHIMNSDVTEEAELSSSTLIPSFPSSPVSLTTDQPSSTTESSSDIQSTLIPTTVIDEDNDASGPSTKESSRMVENPNIRSTFQFSSSHHLAILSRTERSIRSSASSSSSMYSTMNTKNISYGNVDHGSSNHGGGGGGGPMGSAGIVRRSSDMSGQKTKRLNNSRNLHYKNNLDRNERSTVSHLSGPSRKIQMYIKNRFLQLMPDGTVNGTSDDQSEYTILQRSTVDVGRIKVQGVATCLYLCMDPCGAVYGSKDFTDDCVFNENMEQHNYNTYSSTYNSNARRKYYLALNRHGEPRKLQIPPTRSLGKLATYTNAITESVPQERVEQLIAKNFGANRVKHGIRQLCDTGKPLIELIDSKNFKAQPKCNPNSNSNSNSHNSSSNSKIKNNNNNNLSNTNLGNSNNGQSMNNVPAANDKNKLNNSSSMSASARISNRSNNKSESSSSSSNSNNNDSQSSISNSQNNGHISNNGSSSSGSYSTTTMTTTKDSSSSSSSSSSGGSDSGSSSLSSTMKANHRERKKLRKCRPYENEEEHNCQRRPQALQKPGKQRRCRELLLQQQQEGITDIVLPPMCKKKGPKNKGAKNKRLPGEAKGKNALGTDGLGPNNRRGKKLNGGLAGGNGRQAAKQNQNGSGNAGGPKKKQKNNKRNGGGAGGGGGVAAVGKKKQQKLSTTTTKTTTTEQTSSSISTSTPETNFWETSSFLPSSTLYDSYDPHAESTSDRGDREQRNVRYSDSMEDGSMEISAEDDTSAANDDNEDDEEIDDNNDDNEDVSYEDDSYGASSSHLPYAKVDIANPPLTGGADDFLTYDQLDVLPMGLWELIAVMWTIGWTLQKIS